MPAQVGSTCGLEHEESLAGHEEYGPVASEGASARLGELFTQILGMADVVKQVQKEVAQLKQENKALRTQQGLPGHERALRVVASSTDSAAWETGKQALPPAVLETPHAPTEPPPDLGDLPSSLAANRNLKMHMHGDGAEETDVSRRSLTSLNSASYSSEPIATPDIKKQVKATLKRQHTFEPKGRGKSQLSWVAGFRESHMAVAGTERKSQRHSQGLHRDIAEQGLRAMVFDPQAVKQRMKDNISKPDFNVFKFYSTTGYAQKIARSPAFEKITLAIICLNTLWIAVDTEHNRADVLLDAAVGFQIIEHCFCLFFFLELTARFAAFRQKRDCLRSGWFVFEFALVVTMVFEDWIMTLILLAGTDSGRGGTGVGVIKDVAILRLLRLLRLARLGRAMKLLRQSPEIMIMVKAVAASARSVGWTCVLLACLMFFFGVSFTQLCKDSSLENDYFGSLTSSLHTLMIAGLFPDLEVMSRTINKAHFIFWALFVLYLVMTGITVMNLLIGVLVEVAQSSARIERDTLDVTYVKDVFVNTLSLWEVEDFGLISVAQEEFIDLLQEPEILKALTKIGIDVFGLIDLMDFIFMSGPVGFVELLEVVLQLRSSADVTVKDLVEVRKFLTYEMTKLRAEFARLNAGLRETLKERLH